MRRTTMVLCMATIASALFAQTQATLRDIKGKVEVKQPGQNWSPAKDGMKIDTMTTISTGFDSRATLAIADNRIAVAPLTRLTVDKIIEQAGKAGTSLHLRVGKVSADVKSSKGVPQDFKITSPYSTASVRGTKYSFNGRVLDVTDGKVALIVGKVKRDIVIPEALMKKFASLKKDLVEIPEDDKKIAEDVKTGSPEGDAKTAENGEAEKPEGEAEAPAEVAETEAPPEETPDVTQAVAEFMAVLQAENPDDSFNLMDESGKSVSLAPPPPAPAAPAAVEQSAPATTGGQEAPAEATPGEEGVEEAPAEKVAEAAPPAEPEPAAAPEILISAGSVAVISVDYSAPVSSGSKPATQVATGLAGTVSTGAGGGLSGNNTTPKIDAPVYKAPAPAPTTGKIKLKW